MCNRVFTWQQLAASIFTPEEVASQKCLSSLITYCRSLGLGEAISFQKTSFNEIEISKIQKAMKWWQLVNRISNAEFRDEDTCVVLQKNIIHQIINDQPVLFYAVYCPSYKKGINSYGYTGKVGQHTKRSIKIFSNFVIETEKIGIKTDAVAYFSNLILENYDKLIGTSFKDDLASNYTNFQLEFASCSQGKIKTALLSSLESIRRTIGEKGLRKGEIGVPHSIYRSVFNRNKVFYTDKLGWTADMVKERTDVLFRSYAMMGKIFHTLYPYGIMFWTENAYERGAMYQGVSKKCIVPIIYPKKDE